MALKSYNLEGERKAGQTLNGNWFEDRQWQDNTRGIQRSCHGLDLTAQPGYENARYRSVYQETFVTPDVKHRKIPPRQRLREMNEALTISRDLKTEELEVEDHNMYFTRGRYLHEPQLHPELKLDYLNDEPITVHSDKPHHFGRNSLFSQPIQDYTGHEKVKDV
ncbi:hypothetical protein TRFO_36196 [Tritrichomonas foetus]|uniref:Uncharacterized protein n=1 Tax=Tritrichomonas foetus TaxID=1144522 RepID=A0A1J4JEC5_9EUKA|nr:hypothetical protein TRFO_36196 [Tritrichomonas foetus]|eukprot:OHS97550.1 hypothetical protein TRFO_36196 [Tritrichomonas foetus]